MFQRASAIANVTSESLELKSAIPAETYLAQVSEVYRALGLIADGLTYLAAIEPHILTCINNLADGQRVKDQYCLVLQQLVDAAIKAEGGEEFQRSVL